MIDIHAHILPDVDDGAADMDSALEMAALAVESGVTMIVATPHCMGGVQSQNLWEPPLVQAVEAFKKELERENIPIQVFPGMEIFGTPEVPALLKEKRMIGVNQSDYPLIEFSFFHYAGQATEILEEILALGMRPVVAHPERYVYIQQDPTLLNLWVEMGCLLQINKGSLLGRFGEQERRLAMELVGRGFAFAVASDAHSPIMRTTWMAEVEVLLKEAFSAATARRLLKTNPLKLICNEEIHQEEPYWF